jgi:hypothetical protein
MDENIPNQGGINNPPQQPVQTPIPNPAPTPNPVPNQPVAQTVIVKKSPWPWIVGGCLLIVILVIGAFVFLGWWGARKVKDEMNKYQPTMDNVKNSVDEMNKQAEDWQKKSQDLQKNVPNTGNPSK